MNGKSSELCQAFMQKISCGRVLNWKHGSQWRGETSKVRGAANEISRASMIWYADAPPCTIRVLSSAMNFPGTRGWAEPRTKAIIVHIMADSERIVACVHFLASQ